MDYGGPGHLDFWSHCDIFQNLTRHGDSLAPPTQPKRPEKKRLKGALMKMVNDDKHDDEEREKDKRERESDEDEADGSDAPPEAEGDDRICPEHLAIHKPSK